MDYLIPTAWETPSFELGEMEVEVASAKWITEHEGEIYYFCVPGCKAAFENAPARYAGV